MTCINTFGNTYVTNYAVNPRAAALAAEQSKRQRYAPLSMRYRFEQLVVKMTGVLGLQELGRRITAVVRGNAAAITNHP